MEAVQVIATSTGTTAVVVPITPGSGYVPAPGFDKPDEKDSNEDGKV